MSVLINIFTIVLCLYSFSSNAQKKIVLMTSLDPNENRPIGRSSSWNINSKLEKIFFKKLKNEFNRELNYKIIHFSTAKDVAREMADPNNKAIFWVSHSNGSQSSSVLDRNIIVDYNGKDLSETFQNPSNHLQFLAFVGCKSSYIVNKYSDMGLMSNNEHLRIFSSPKKVDARAALKKSIKSYKKHLKNNQLFSSVKKCSLVNRQEIEIKRKVGMGKFNTSIKVLQKGYLLGVFPSGEMGETQYLKVNLMPSENKRNLKLVFDSGITSEEVVMGDFEVLHTDYQAFSTRSGRILGKGRYVFNFKGEISNLPEIKLVNKQNCID